MRKSPKFPLKSSSDKKLCNSLYLINDQYNSFEHVVNCLAIICDHDELQAEQCALITHYKGICEIAVGEKKDLLALQEDLSIYGLNVEIF